MIQLTREEVQRLIEFLEAVDKGFPGIAKYEIELLQSKLSEPAPKPMTGSLPD